MKIQKIALVDNNDKFLGFEELNRAHFGDGKHHRGFSTLIFDSRGRVLLQKRKHKIFDGFWDFTVASHPVRNGRGVETYQQASDRALETELGIGHVDVKSVYEINYFAKDGQNAENEFCPVLVGRWAGRHVPNLDVVYETKWVTLENLLDDISKNPKKYTPWAMKSLVVLKKLRLNGFFWDIGDFSAQFAKYSKGFFTSKKKVLKSYPKLIEGFYFNLQDFGVGGKAMRPYLVYLGYKLGGGRDINKILPICLAVELVHNFLLIHDDIIDKSGTRRGKLTIHKRYEKKFGKHYGTSQAIVAGDIAMMEAFGLINKANFPPKLKEESISLLMNYLLETAFGEALDVEYSYKRPSLAKILQVAELKTARYSFVGPLEIGANLAGAKPEQIKAIGNYGKKVGIAFQLQDDILGVYGEEDVTGKSSRSDMREGKNTVLFHKARDMAKGEDLRNLESIWGKVNASGKDLVRVRQIIKKSGAYGWCTNKMQSLVQSAKRVARQVTGDRELLEILRENADFVIARDK